MKSLWCHGDENVKSNFRFTIRRWAVLCVMMSWRWNHLWSHGERLFRTYTTFPHLLERAYQHRSKIESAHWTKKDIFRHNGLLQKWQLSPWRHTTKHVVNSESPSCHVKSYSISSYQDWVTVMSCIDMDINPYDQTLQIHILVKLPKRPLGWGCIHVFMYGSLID